MSIRKPHSYATSSGYLTAPNWNVLPSPVWDSADHYDEWEIKKPKFIPTPDWVERIEGYSEEAFDITNGPQYSNERIVAVCYKPEKTLGVGFTKVFFADKDLKNVFPQMKGMWKETQRRIDSETALYPPKIGKCKIDGVGRISSAFGIPDLPSLLDIVLEMYTVWLDWHEFPNVGEFSMVKRLIQAKQDVATMQREMSSNRINGEIENIRQEIKESQERIVNLEKKLNDIYEKAADAMNLLEENGVKIDLDEKKNGEETAYATMDGYDHPIISHAYPGQGILVNPSPSGSLISTLPPSTFQLSKEEIEVFRKELEDASSYLTVDNSDSALSKIRACP